ncbi:MAG: serine hydrolase [Bacteroidota bacterium]
MKVRRRYVFLLTLFSLLLIGYLVAKPLLRTATGYAAKQACSCHFLQGRELEDIAENDLNFSLLTRVKLDFNHEYDGVEARLFGLFKREARYITGQGCILINDRKLGLPPVQPLPLADGTAADSVMNFEPLLDSLDLDTAQLAAALDFGMTPVTGGGARAVAVFQAGNLLAERYAAGYDAKTLLPGWSMTKTITGLLLGQRNLLPEQASLFREWGDDERAQIKLDDLMKMSSGLAWEESYGSMTDATRMLHHRPDFAQYTCSKKAKQPPGEEWVYSSGTTNILMELYLRSFPDRQAGINAIYTDLFYPIGAYSFRIEPDQSGRPVGSSYAWATARDWARIGQLMLQEGRWEGQQIVPAAWIAYMREPAPACADGDYGGQTWLKGPDMPSLPDNAFLLRGFQDQRVIVIPDQELVIVRLGHNDDQTADFDGLVSRVLAALS